MLFFDVKIRDNQTKKKIGKQILSSRWHLRHGCQFWESPHASPFRRESRSLVLKKLAIKKNAPDARCFGCVLSFCFSNIPRWQFTKRSLFDSLLKKIFGWWKPISLNGRLGFPGFKKKATTIFSLQPTIDTIRAFFRCNHQQHRQRNSKTVNGKADICQQKGLRVEQLILLRQLVLMSSFAGCIHHKSHDAIAVSEDDGIVRQIGQTSPRLLKTLQKTHSSNSPGNISTTRKPSTTCSNSMSHQKQTSEKKNGWRIEFRNRLAAHHVGVNRNRFLPSTFDLAVTQRVRWWKLRPFHRNRTRGIDSARFFFFECLGDGCWKKPLASWKNVSRKKTDMHVGSIDFLL